MPECVFFFLHSRLSIVRRMLESSSYSGVWHFILLFCRWASVFLGTIHIDNSLSILTAQSVNHNYNIFHFFAIGCGRFSQCMSLFSHSPLLSLLHLVLFGTLFSSSFASFCESRTENYGCNYDFWHMSIWLFFALLRSAHTVWSYWFSAWSLSFYYCLKICCDRSIDSLIVVGSFIFLRFWVSQKVYVLICRYIGWSFTSWIVDDNFFSFNFSLCSFMAYSSMLTADKKRWDEREMLSCQLCAVITAHCHWVILLLSSCIVRQSMVWRLLHCLRVCIVFAIVEW